jgi:hypothetical protein
MVGGSVSLEPGRVWTPLNMVFAIFSLTVNILVNCSIWSKRRRAWSKQVSWFVYFWCPFQPASATFICFTNGLRLIFSTTSGPWPNIRILASIWYSHNSPLLLSDDPHVWHSLPSSVQALSYSSSMTQCRSLLRTKKTGDPPLSLICLLLTFVLGQIHANKTLARFMNPTGLWCDFFIFTMQCYCLWCHCDVIVIFSFYYANATAYGAEF